MKITIKGIEKKDICIRIPTRLALNGLTAKLATSKLVMKKLDEKDMPPLTYEQMKTVMKHAAVSPIGRSWRWRRQTAKKSL